MSRLLAVAVLVLVPAWAGGQTLTQPRKPVPTRPAPVQERLGIRGYAVFGGTTLTAHETFDAVADTRSRASFGGGVQVTNIWRSVFADVAGSHLSLDGQRVFVNDGRVFDLGIPLEITMRPLDIAAGWRHRMLRGRLFPYVGAGLTYLRYEETSQFAGGGEDVSTSKAGPLVLGGADFVVWRWVSAGGEVRWRRVRGILGEGGVSSEFEENDAGGFNAAVRLSFGR